MKIEIFLYKRVGSKFTDTIQKNKNKMRQNISIIKNLKTIKALGGESLTIDLGETFTGTLTSWMKKDTKASEYIEFEIKELEIIVTCKIKTIYKTGVEVEAMHGASVVALTIDEVGNVAAFLCSDLASGITGETTFVDAGANIMGMVFDED